MFWGKRKITVDEIVNTLLQVTEQIYDGFSEIEASFDENQFDKDNAIAGKIFFCRFAVWNAFSYLNTKHGMVMVGMDISYKYQGSVYTHMNKIINLSENQIKCLNAIGENEEKGDRTEKYLKLLSSEENKMHELSKELYKDIYGQDVRSDIALMLVHKLIHSEKATVEYLKEIENKYEIVDD